MLYRFYDRSRALLYVGVTGRGLRRWRAHAKNKPWWPEVTKVDVAHFGTWEAALAAEAEAIRVEEPRWNINRPRAHKLAVVTGKGTTRHSIRIEDDLWAVLERDAARMGSDRSTVLREFARYYTRQPGARMPKRPPPLGDTDELPERPGRH